LLDPEFALPALIDEGVVRRDTGVLVAVEVSGAIERRGFRETELLPDLGATGVRRLGGTAAKLLVYVRPDREDRDGPNGRLIAEVARDCAAADLLLVVEILTYRLADEDVDSYAAAKPRLIHAAALLAEACGAKVLKLESPGSEAHCRALTDALEAPWAVLSAGVDHQTFVATLREAMAGGASGFIAGRSLWKEAVLLSPAERRDFLRDEARRRLQELVALVH
jgi:tagatose 1,6-diphosphate aldolase